jgi:hypothetical protein
MAYQCGGNWLRLLLLLLLVFTLLLLGVTVPVHSPVHLLLLPR